MAENYQRAKDGFRLRQGGMKLNALPDSLGPGKHALAINVRGVQQQSTVSRPGQSLRFATGGLPITDISSYASLNTDDQPRYLARDTQDNIWLDDSIIVGTLAGGGSSPGCTFIPFRPNQSPNPYIYAANGNDYQKFSAPSASNVVTKQNVGIQEPPTPPTAFMSNVGQIIYEPTSANYTAGGSAGSAGNSVRVTDTVAAVFTDPAAGATIQSLQVTSTVSYQKNMPLQVGPNPETFIVQDIFAPLPTAITIQEIVYFNGLTGHCNIVPAGLTSGDEEASIYTQQLLANLRRGALLQMVGELVYVLSVSTGPDGGVSIETSTINKHAAGEVITSVPAIQIMYVAPQTAVTAGMAISAAAVDYTVGTGIGTQTVDLTVSPVVTSAGVSLQPDDYLSFGVWVNPLSNLNEVKILIDVSDSTFTRDFYYYTIRPSDIAQAVDNALTQVAASQIVTQRAVIDEENAAASNNQGQTYSSAQTSPGDAQWSQILVPLSEFTRVGSDQTKTLQNAVAFQFLWNVSASVPVQTSFFDFFGSFQPDVGNSGAPIKYRVRPRNTVTGVVGNPSPAMRYGVNPRREQITVNLPSAAYDPQINAWDILRYGGTVTQWRFVGTTPSTNTTFIDNFDDDAVNAGAPLDFDNFQPWPSIDLPLNALATIVAGNLAIVFIPGTTNVLRYLPGNEVQIGTQNVYTLWTRPTLISASFGLYLFQFEENAGSGTDLAVAIYEPQLAQQRVPYMWGPDATGTVFGCGDPLRAGSVYFSKNYALDSAPDTYNLEIVQPSEPLLGGEILNGLCYLASTERWWALIPSPDNTAQRFTPRQEPISRGLIAPFGHCNDGMSIYWWAKDGIWSSSKGSLTDADLFNLFPHESDPGLPVSYGGFTIQPPDYSRAGTFRLTYSNGYLYAIYQDSTGTYRTLTYDTHLDAWCSDSYIPAVSTFYASDQQAGTLLTTTIRYPQLLMGNISGQVAAQAALTNDLGGPIACVLGTFEFDGGDVRAGQEWGDIYFDGLPSSANLLLTPMSKGAAAYAPTLVSQASTRTMTPISLGGDILLNFLGLLFTWTDDFSSQSSPTILNIWQPSFLLKPEMTIDRFTDWDDIGSSSNKWWQGFILHADTMDQVKSIVVRDADTLTTHPFTPIVQHNGESELAYSFNTPFYGHMVRIEPADSVPWRLFAVRWIAQPTPELAETWQTQGSTHGLKGYMHLRQLSITYLSTSAITLTIGVYDGTPPVPITIPSSSGAVQKTVLVPTFNKGQLYFYKFSSAQPFQIYQDKSEVLVGAWGRGDGYINRPLVGDLGGDEAKI